jgi:hypothetical protein
VQFDGDRYAKGRMTSEGNNTRTWTVAFRPGVGAQTVVVSANTGYFTRGATNQNFELTMGATATVAPPSTNVATGEATISAVRTNRSNIIFGENTTFTITTNVRATDVWLDVDNRDVPARLTRESRTTKTWTVTVSPDRSQTVTVFANSGADEVAGAARRTHRITVNDRRYIDDRDRFFGSARIISAHVDNNWWNANSFVRIVVETNSITNFVWIDAGSNRLATMTHSTTLSNGNRRWVYDLDLGNWNWWWGTNWNWNQVVTIRAGESNGATSDSTTLNLGNWWGGLQHPGIVHNATVSAAQGAGNTVNITIGNWGSLWPNAAFFGNSAVTARITGPGNYNQTFPLNNFVTTHNLGSNFTVEGTYSITLFVGNMGVASNTMKLTPAS